MYLGGGWGREEGAGVPTIEGGSGSVLYWCTCTKICVAIQLYGFKIGINITN